MNTFVLLKIWFKIKMFSHPTITDSHYYGHQIASQGGIDCNLCHNVLKSAGLCKNITIPPLFGLPIPLGIPMWHHILIFQSLGFPDPLPTLISQSPSVGEEWVFPRTPHYVKEQFLLQPFNLHTHFNWDLKNEHQNLKFFCVNLGTTPTLLIPLFQMVTRLLLMCNLTWQ